MTVIWVIAIIVFAGTETVSLLLFPDTGAGGVNRFTLLGFLICTICVPFQAAAEEYVFRGLLMQTIGAWTRLPVAAMVLSSLVFALTHTYGLLGIAAVFCDGLMFAFVSWYTRGLEASSAAHIINNMTIFYCTGLGLASSREGGVDSLILVIVMNIIYCAILILLDKKFNWFTLKEQEDPNIQNRRE